MAEIAQLPYNICKVSDVVRTYLAEKWAILLGESWFPVIADSPLLPYKMD